MSTDKIYAITPHTANQQAREVKEKIWLVKPPYFTPWTPPLGIAVLKSYLEQHGYSVECHDLNTDAELWGMHHHYFRALQAQEDASNNEGYSTLWWILNAHMLAYVNGAGASGCARVLEGILSLYRIEPDRALIASLLLLVEKYFERLGVLVDECDLSGFSVAGTSTYTTSLASSLFILRRFKQQQPDIKTVMGGGIFADDLALGSDNLTTLVEEYPYVDHMILGEGELLFLKLLEGELAHKRVISIADLKGTTLSMKDVPSPSFADLKISDYFHLTIEGARSCPFQCNFCSETIQWGEYRKKPMDLFAEQVIDLAQRYENNSFFMGDSLMNPYINEFSQLLLDKQANILYDGYLRADKPVANRERVKVWARSGLYRVRLGVESAAKRVLASMDKMTSPDTIAEVLKSLSSAGIRTTTYWIVGFPGETEEDFQETLDFIRENHRYIYELEAHPYYYYPYGQVGSRLYQCHSLYPDEVTEIIKFRAWDVEGLKPPREERYERLRRISQLASEVRLPNIYTMAERFVAEDRWRTLHPLAVDVYNSASAQREKVRFKGEPLQVFAEQFTQTPDESQETGALCYEAKVAKRLEIKTLDGTLKHLAEYHETLQVRLSDGYHHPTNGADEERQNPVGVFQYDEAESASREDFKRATIARLSKTLRPQPGDNLKVAVFQSAPASNELVLLAHPSIVDGRALTLLFEDLHRLYEQLSQGLQPNLPPGEKNYTEAVAAISSARGAGVADTVPQARSKDSDIHRRDGGEVKSSVIELDPALARRIQTNKAARNWFQMAEILLLALVRSIAKSQQSARVVLDTTYDDRLTDATLQRTVGRLTTICPVPRPAILNLTWARLPEMQAALAQISAGAAQASPAQASESSQRALVDLERFVAAPWLGGDEWKPQGFVSATDELRMGYDLQITPHLSPEWIRVEFRYEAGGGLEGLAKELSERLPLEIEEILEKCEEYAAAEAFWRQELGEDFSTNPEGIDEHVSADPQADEWQATPSHDIELSLLDEVAGATGAESYDVLLAAYGLLLSRLNDESEVVVLSSISNHQKSLFPVKLRPSWEMSFADYLETTKRQIARARQYSEPVFDILTRRTMATKNTPTPPGFDIGFVYSETTDDRETAMLKEAVEERMGHYRGAELLLIAIKGGDGCIVQFYHRGGKQSLPMVERLGSFFESILEDIVQSAEI